MPGEPADLLGLSPPWGSPLDEELVAELEVALLLLPLRVRLEALVAASTLVDTWADLLGKRLLLGYGLVWV